MSEQESRTGAEPEEAPGANPESREEALEPAPEPSEPPTPSPPPAPRRRAGIAARAGAAVLALAVLGGIGFTAVTVRGADRDAGAPVLTFPKPTADDADDADDDADEEKGLRALLVPYQDGRYEKGPDLGEFGSDVELTGQEAWDLVKASLTDVPRSERRAMEREMEKRVRGHAARSYVYEDPFGGSYGSALLIEIALSEMENPADVRRVATSQIETYDLLGVFDDGPRVEGHDDARCYEAPEEDPPLADGRVLCVGHRGNVLVNVSVAAHSEVDTEVVADLVAEQLDRIDNPGEAV
ncbi:hypothetical protein ABZX40_09535 [Streptomyces sp. NPDC004610]|uniref:hypothetical protein n=1 Tax=unclassified Streptomyces TaxID=2593676 RepID=UPI0033AC7EE1